MENRMTVEELQNLLLEEQRARREAQRRAEEAEQQRQEAEQQRQEAEQQRQTAEQQRQTAEQQRQTAEEQTRHTTLAEYIETCHDLVFTKFAVETDKSLTSKGSTTNPRDKLCPARLSPWTDFLELQKTTVAALHSTFPAEAQAFESRSFLRGLGERVSRKKVANERDLEYFQHISVEDPVRSVIERIGIEDGAKQEFGIGNGIIFENHPSAISDVADEVLERRATQAPPSTPGWPRPPDLRQLRPDQICVYSHDATSTGRSMAYIIEYKAPHKLTLPHLRLGLRSMHIYSEVVNRPTKPTANDAEALFQYHADRLVAAAVTQTFHYMIEGGLEYSYMTTGEAIVFLKVDWADPTTLYYHLAEPGPEVLAHPDSFHYCTAVGQCLAFSLVALGAPANTREHSQGERHRAMQCLETWTEDYEAILRSIPATERDAPPSSPGYEPRTYSTVDRSPRITRGKKDGAARMDHVESSTARENRTPEPSDDEGAQMPGTPSPTLSRNRGQSGQCAQRGRAQQPRGGHQGRQYCTQKCLLGVVGRGTLDQMCPNVALHRGQSGHVHHPIDHAEWLRLLREQLRQTLDDGVVRIGRQGARGAMFQVTLLAYGYTFIAKGTVPEFVPDLEHEAAVYRRLQPLQGSCVPVFLGAIDLRHIARIYYYDFRVRIVHMTFLSFAGDSLDAEIWEPGPSRCRELTESVRSLHAMGVAHTDVREANVLWSRDTGRPMIIDFERAVLMDPPRAPLGQVVPNKRARAPEEMGVTKTLSQPRSQVEWNNQTRNDMSAARSIFQT